MWPCPSWHQTNVMPEKLAAEGPEHSRGNSWQLGRTQECDATAWSPAPECGPADGRKLRRGGPTGSPSSRARGVARPGPQRAPRPRPSEPTSRGGVSHVGRAPGWALLCHPFTRGPRTRHSLLGLSLHIVSVSFQTPSCLLELVSSEVFIAKEGKQAPNSELSTGRRASHAKNGPLSGKSAHRPLTFLASKTAISFMK